MDYWGRISVGTRFSLRQISAGAVGRESKIFPAEYRAGMISTRLLNLCSCPNFVKYTEMAFSVAHKEFHYQLGFTVAHFAAE
jgi:hypothetical protein